MTSPLLVLVRPAPEGAAVLVERLTGRPADVEAIRAALAGLPPGRPR